MAEQHFSPEQQKLLDHSLRSAIMRILAASPMTAKQVAQTLESSVGNVHYHLQRLVAADLLSVSDDLAGDGTREKRYHVSSMSSPVKLNTAAPELLALSETLWLNVVEAGQLVNEMNALVYRWRADHGRERGRTQAVTLTIHCQLLQ